MFAFFSHFTRGAALLALWLPTTLQAQTRLSVGPRAGFHLSRLRYHVEDLPGRRYHQRALPGYELGVSAQCRLGSWALQPALLLSTKGEASDVRATVPTAQGSYELHNRFRERYNYLELPVHLAYQPAWARGAQVFAGPYLAVGVGGHYHAEVQQHDLDGNYLGTVVRDSRLRYAGISQPGSSPRTLDYGLEAGLGYQRGRWLAQAQLGWGLRSVDGNYQDGQYHRVAALALTYWALQAGQSAR
jgi:hypothetical protein